MIDGTYKLTIHAPIGKQELMCDIAAKDGVVTGRAYKPGTDFDAPFYEGTCEGDSFRFKVDFPVKGMGSFTFTLSGEGEDGRLEGQAKIALGKCKFEAERA